jgi:hypothetical protein
MMRPDCERCGQYEQAPELDNGLCWDCATADIEEASDDGHRQDGEGVGDRPADGTGGRPDAGGGADPDEGASEGAGAGEGSGLEPRVGEVEGYRVFWVRGDELHPLAVGSAWQPGTNTAQCRNAGPAKTKTKKTKTKTTTWVNDGAKLKEIPLEDDEPEDQAHGLIPSAECGCGFWVFKSAERARARFAADLKRPRSSSYGDFDGADELVMAKVAGWGRAVEGADGWRFEKARVIALVTDEPHRHRRLLDHYGIEALQTVGLEPWIDFEPRSLAETFDLVENYIGKYVVLSSEQRCAVVLWVAATWIPDAFDVSPYIALQSAVMRSGKTQLVGATSHVVAEPWIAIQPSEAILFRRIHKTSPTLFLDEVDTLFKSKDDRHEPLRALLNAGNRRGTTVPRLVKTTKDEFEVVDFKVYCPKMLAGIGRLPVTVADRSVIIKMERKLSADITARYREKLVMAAAAEPRQQLAMWAGSGVVERLREVWPALPDELNDRAQDIWEPLLAIADEAGGDWPSRARAAAVVLAEAVDDVPHGVQLLSDIREVLVDVDRITTELLLKALIETDPWGAWWGDQVEAGKLKSPAARLSRMLGEFGIRPKQLRIDGVKARGYERADLLDAWKRNLPDLPPEDGTDGTEGPSQVSDGASDQQRTVRTVRTDFPRDGEDAPDPEAQFIRDWNAEVYRQAREHRRRSDLGDPDSEPAPDPELEFEDPEEPA